MEGEGWHQLQACTCMQTDKCSCTPSPTCTCMQTEKCSCTPTPVHVCKQTKARVPQHMYMHANKYPHNTCTCRQTNACVPQHLYMHAHRQMLMYPHNTSTCAQTDKCLCTPTPRHACKQTNACVLPTPAHACKQTNAHVSPNTCTCMQTNVYVPQHLYMHANRQMLMYPHNTCTCMQTDKYSCTPTPVRECKQTNACVSPHNKHADIYTPKQHTNGKRKIKGSYMNIRNIGENGPGVVAQSMEHWSNKHEAMTSVPGTT